LPVRIFSKKYFIAFLLFGLSIMKILVGNLELN